MAPGVGRDFNCSWEHCGKVGFPLFLKGRFRALVRSRLVGNRDATDYYEGFCANQWSFSHSTVNPISADTTGYIPMSDLIIVLLRTATRVSFSAVR